VVRRYLPHVESKKGVSALQLHRTLGVARRTAWYLSHRIRAAMANDPLEGPTLVGVVEVDETLVGGKAPARATATGATSSGSPGPSSAMATCGWRRCQTSGARPSTTSSTATVADQADAIYTDELKSYIGIEDDGTRHETVNHSAEEWVVGDVHTNSIEGVWSLFKRSIIGSFHKVSVKHIDRYLSELERRFNNRGNDHIFLDTLRRIVHTETMTYRDLVA